MFRKYLTTLLFVCILSLCFYHSLSYADKPDTIDNQETKLTNIERDTDRFKDEYNKLHGYLQTLINNFDTTKTQIEQGVETIVFRTGAALIATGVAYYTGGSYAPAAWLAWYSLKEAIEIIEYDSDQYLNAMGATLSAMDIAYDNVIYSYGGSLVAYGSVLGGWVYDYDPILEEATKYWTTGYLTEYKKYLQMLTDHNLARQDANGNISNQAVNKEELDKQVNLQNLDSGWYHAGATSPSDGDHTIVKRYRISGIEDPFEEIYECEGQGEDMFRTPWEAFSNHRKKCEVCNRVYYKCDRNYAADEFHKPRECKLKYFESTPHGLVEVDCPHTYRFCTPILRHHSDPSRRDADNIYCLCTIDVTWPVVPTPPGSLSLTPGSTSIQLSWTPPVSDGGSSITDYEYQYRLRTWGIDRWSSWTSVGTSTSANITDLSSDTGYAVRIRAENSVGYSYETSASNVRTTNDNDDSDDEEASTPPAVFTPSLSLTYNSSTSSVSMIATASEPIYGADLYVRFPGDTSKYGTKIGWTSGNSDSTTYALPVNYSFPSPASSGTYKFTLRVYPFNNSGSGDAWGDAYDVFENVTVE